jgi:hypothetical protein
LNYARIYQAHEAKRRRICLQASRSQLRFPRARYLTFLPNALHGYVVLV